MVIILYLIIKTRSPRHLMGVFEMNALQGNAFNVIVGG